MYYEINVALNGKHFFATAKRSLTSMKEFQSAWKVFQKKFPPKEGYHISAEYIPECGFGIPDEVINDYDKLCKYLEECK